jgi:hypothetical protein
MSDKYITQAELRIEPYSIPESKVNKKYLEVLQDLTKELIDETCKQEFEQEGTPSAPVEKRLDGSDKSTLFVEKRLISLDKVRIYIADNSYTDYTAGNFTISKWYIDWNIYSTSYVSARVAFQMDMFPRGIKNIGVFGVWGWESCPNPMKYVQAQLIKKVLSDKSMVQRFQSENIGDYSYAMKAIADEIFGDPEIDLIIKQYTAWRVYAF